MKHRGEMVSVWDETWPLFDALAHVSSVVDPAWDCVPEHFLYLAASQ